MYSYIKLSSCLPPLILFTDTFILIVKSVSCETISCKVICLQGKRLDDSVSQGGSVSMSASVCLPSLKELG